MVRHELNLQKWFCVVPIRQDCAGVKHHDDRKAFQNQSHADNGFVTVDRLKLTQAIFLLTNFFVF